MSTITAKPIPAPSAPVVTAPARIAVRLIHPSPLNPRRVAPEERDELAPSLRAQGQLMPLWVRPHREIENAFELVDGERRWWGLKAADIAEARVEVGDFSDEDILRITWTTGTEGKGLTPLEQARWANAAMARPGATLESVGALVGVQGSSLAKKLALLELSAKVQEAVQSGELPPLTAYLIAGVPGAARERFAAEVMHPEDEPGPLSFAAAQALRRGSYARTLKAAPFDPEDAGLVLSAGPCGTCRFRAGNNLEEYGPTKSPNTCMHVACFAEKEAAARAKRVALEAGKVALSAIDNAVVFPAGATEAAPASGYVAATRPIPADLVKDEVAAQGAPSFAEVSPAAQVYVGTDGQGRLVDLVKLEEAMTAATEPTIFRAHYAQRYGMKDNEAAKHRNSDDETVQTPALRDVAPAKAEPTKGSIAGEQKRAAKAEKTAEKSKAKKLRACAEWMLDLFESLTAGPKLKPEGYAYTRASLKWEHLIRSVPDEDALLVLRALSEDDPAKGQSGKDALKEFVAGIGGTEELDAVCDLLLIASALRAQGAEAEWVVEWHRHLVEPVGAHAKVAPVTGEQIASEEERAKLTEIVRAHADGMPVEEIAKSYELPLAEVCGMLQVPVPGGAAAVKKGRR